MRSTDFVRIPAATLLFAATAAFGCTSAGAEVAAPQYRSAIFASTEEQARVARAYVEQLNRARAFGRDVVTAITPLPRFYEAEPEHQDYAARHPTAPYIVMHDAPKVERLRRDFPDRFVAR